MGSIALRTTVRTVAVAVTLTAVSALGLSVGAGAAHAQTSSPGPLDQLGRPTPQTQVQVRDFANQPWVPVEMRNAILSALAFSAGDNGDGGPALPENAPTFTQFYWPTVAGSCIGGELDAVGTAIAVPGPAAIPAPGARAGQTAFVFTALGTAPALPEQGGMNVTWFNLNTLQNGVTPLGNYGINPDGPATLSGTADTGHGTVVALVSGDVRTEDATCNFLPTAAIIDAR
ncbi:Rv1157c family protein [Corynebacterium comes]|uniref:Secreted protein n=1 Tax=Corynebacterium comes TaxID=2675218 RepID=A0A6B8VZX4_9CORY|nr:hypothetical protein [Corynebacterium comes]QGU04256.1 hypothetical protein CETAM_04925 [Corynebacterium comes]